MTRSKRYAAGFLLAGLLLATGTPVYVSHVAPHLAGYLMHPWIVLGQALPFAVCAAIWLPLRAPTAASAGKILAGLLLVAALALYLPILLMRSKNGGDMVGLAYILISLIGTGAVLLGSAVAGVVLWRRARRSSLVP